MNQEERFKALEEVLEELSLFPDNMVILVEGINDKRSLNGLHIHRDMIAVQSEGGPLKTAESLYEKGRGAIILTDWDRKGEQIAGELKRNLTSLCVPFDLSIRARLKGLCVKDIKDVESLFALYVRLKEEDK